MLLEEVLESLGEMSEQGRATLRAEVESKLSTMRWIPNSGPQREAYFCEADELFFGGQAGPGKSDLGLGLACNEHKRSLFLREFNDDALSAAERFLEIIGSRDGWNGQLTRYFKNGKLVEFGGCKAEDDKQRYKGDPHDLIVFDEIGDFTETQYRFIIAWNRTVDPNQRCRVVCTGNPPTRAKGMWVISRWAAWLDPNHPNPAAPGELRWYTTSEDGRDIEVDGPGPHLIGGREVMAKSRTFIRGELSDNPDLARTDYDNTLSALPKELRDAYRDGRFDASIADEPFQLIPTDWVVAAQNRWRDRVPDGVPMCAIAIDPAQGGTDDNVIARRHDGWYAPLVKIPGRDTPVGTDASGVIITHRRDGALVIVDCGGGYGGSIVAHLRENGIEVYAHKGAEASSQKTKDKQLGFFNKRCEVMWRFREALDPDQPGGSPISLPQSMELRADLTAPTFEVVKQGIKVEPKEKLVERLGRSTNEGDAVIMCWAKGPKAVTHAHHWRSGEQGIISGRRRPQVILGHQACKKLTSNRRQTWAGY